ncbi:MAG: DUF86 domain-containing protein [Bacteroidetes bacterium SW_9_63_38]|nr:MAG: DUF86 domain-containing protein [Bacteroidetes bacterium SW_9_63_38]
MNDFQRDAIYLEHIAERTRRIEEATQNGREAFESSHILQDAVIRNFEVIGEAVKKLSPELRDAHPDVPWQRVAGFRDVLIHDYMGVDLNEVWNVIEQELPRLKRTVEEMRQEIGDDENR